MKILQGLNSESKNEQCFKTCHAFSSLFIKLTVKSRRQNMKRRGTQTRKDIDEGGSKKTEKEIYFEEPFPIF